MRRRAVSRWARISPRVPLRYFVPAVVLTTALCLAGYELVAQPHRAERETELEAEAELRQILHLAQGPIEDALRDGDESALSNEISGLASDPRAIYALVVDENNEVLASSRLADVGEPLPTRPPSSPVYAELISQARAERRVGTRLLAGGSGIAGYAPLVIHRASEPGLRPTDFGALVIHLDLSHAKAVVRRRVERQVLETTAVIITLALVMWGLFHVRLTARVSTMVSAAERLAEGDLTARTGVRGQDELAEVARAFDRMAERVAESQRGLEKEIRTREEFISIASHELMTPLSALRLQLEALQKTVARAGPQAVTLEKLDKALRQTSKMSLLINNLLDLTRLLSERFVLNKEPFDLADAAREGVERLRGQAVQAGARLSLIAPGKAPGDWDRLRIDQVITNLISNAIKYGEGTPITVHVWREGDLARLDVRDEGPGIDPEQIERIFERFERGSAGAAHPGLGLGLYITRQIVEAHGGQVWAESRPGLGATFRVVLPALPAAWFGTVAGAPGPKAEERPPAS